MSRPLRIEFPGAVYHVTSRGSRRESIYKDNADRSAQLEILAHGSGAAGPGTRSCLLPRRCGGTRIKARTPRWPSLEWRRSA